MASKFDQRWTDSGANDSLDAEFFETIQVVPVGDVSRNIRALVKRETRRQVYGEGLRNFYNAMDIEVRIVDANGAAYTPKEIRNGGDMDAFTIDGKSWLLQRVQARNLAGLHLLELFDEGVSV